MSRSKNGFVALETIAIALLVILVLVVIAFFTLKTQNSDSPLAETRSETFQDKLANLQNEKKYQLAESNNLFSEDFEGVPFNERLFFQAQVNHAPYIKASPTTTGRFQGTVTSVDHKGGLHIKLKSLMHNSLDQELEFRYKEHMLKVISVSYGTVNDIQPGDNINIDETNDVTKQYDESVVAVEISRIE